jgi:hypothetical protein
LHQVAAPLDQPPQRSHVRALWLQWLELVAVADQQLQDHLGVGRVVLGAARREGLAVVSYRRGLHQKQAKEIVLEQCRDDRAPAQLHAHRYRSAAEALPQLARPSLNGPWSVLQHQPLALGAAGNLQAHVVLLVRPVDTNEGGVDVFTLVHVFASRTVGGRDMRSRTLRRQYGEPVTAAFPEYSLTGLAAPAGAKASWKASRARRCKFVTGRRMSRAPLSPLRETMDSGSEHP